MFAHVATMNKGVHLGPERDTDFTLQKEPTLAIISLVKT